MTSASTSVISAGHALQRRRHGDSKTPIFWDPMEIDGVTGNLQKIRFFRARIPAFECVPGCHDCCGPVTASSEEMFELPLIDDAGHKAALADLSCPHLGADGCSAYLERPLICRLFGTTPRLVCPRGKGPLSMTDPLLDAQIQRFFLDTRQVLV
jgi:hypothetical protein